MKKLFSIIGFLACWVLQSSAQVSVEVVLDQREFLAGEALPASVKITNRSGQPIHLGADPKWLTFTVASEEGSDVFKNDEVPVLGEFDLESSQQATKHVDLGPYFTVHKAGRYKIVATLRIKDWSAEQVSPPTFYDIINASALWSQDFGMPAADGTTNRAPEVRTFTLLKANYLTSQLRLYVQISNPATAQVYKVAAIGPLVSFSAPEAQVDALGNLHVLFQSGASIFSYLLIDPSGTVFRHELYDYVAKHPRLGVNSQGEITVAGGVRRLKSQEMPMVKMPAEVLLPPGGN